MNYCEVSYKPFTEAVSVILKYMGTAGRLSSLFFVPITFSPFLYCNSFTPLLSHSQQLYYDKFKKQVCSYKIIIIIRGLELFWRFSCCMDRCLLTPFLEGKISAMKAKFKLTCVCLVCLILLTLMFSVLIYGIIPLSQCNSRSSG